MNTHFATIKCSFSCWNAILGQNQKIDTIEIREEPAPMNLSSIIDTHLKDEECIEHINEPHHMSIFRIWTPILSRIYLFFFPKPLLNMGMSLPQMRTIASDYFAPPPMRCSPPWLKLLTVSLHQRTEVRQDLDSVNGFTGDLWDPWWYCHVLGACMHNRLVVLYCTN